MKCPSPSPRAFGACPPPSPHTQGDACSLLHYAPARLMLLSLAPYFASEPHLRGGGLSDYPRRRRSPSEAKYGAKKGISDGG